MPASFQQLDDDMSWRISEGQKKKWKNILTVSLFGTGMWYNGRDEAIFGAGRRNRYGGNWGFLWTN